MPARDIDQALISRHGPGDPAPAAVLVAEAVLHPHGLHAFGEPRAPGPRVRRVVGMTQRVDMHRLDLGLAPAQHARPGRIERGEVAVERRHAEKILGYAPDPVALARALGEIARGALELAMLADELGHE